MEGGLWEGQDQGQAWPGGSRLERVNRSNGKPLEDFKAGEM